MREALCRWMKNLAVYYILFTFFLHLVPDSAYERWIRLFMGLVLVLLLGMPAFSILGAGGEFMQSFRELYEQETNLSMQDLPELSQKTSGEDYLEETYCTAVREKICQALSSVEWKDIQVGLDEEKLHLSLVLEGGEDEEKEAQILDELESSLGITVQNSEIEITFDEAAAVGDPDSGRSSSVRDGTSGVEPGQ